MKRFIYMGCLLSCLTVLSCGRKEAAADAVPTVYLAEVKNASQTGIVTFTGKTKAAAEVNHSFRVAGQIERVWVKEGDFVRKGQVLAEMDERDYVVQLEAARAEYAQVKADAERVMALYAEGNVTASNYDKARYGLQQMAQKLASCENQLADTKLRSSVTGYVQTRFHEPGETVSAGMAVVSVFEGDDVEVEIKVSSSDFMDLDRLSGYYCRFESMRDKSFPLSVARVSQEANASQLYGVRLKFADGQDLTKITPGMTTIVYAELAEAAAERGFVIPASAVLHQQGRSYVFVYSSDTGTIHRRAVQVATAKRDGTMVVAAELTAGERVVAAGVHHVEDGQRVKVMEKPAESNVGSLL